MEVPAMRLQMPKFGGLYLLLAILMISSGCVEGEKPTPLKRFDPSLVPAAEKKDKEPEADKAKNSPPEKEK